MTAAVRPMAVINALRRVINLRARRGAALRGDSLGVSLRLSSGIEAEPPWLAKKSYFKFCQESPKGQLLKARKPLTFDL